MYECSSISVFILKISLLGPTPWLIEKFIFPKESNKKKPWEAQQNNETPIKQLFLQIKDIQMKHLHSMGKQQLY